MDQRSTSDKQAPQLGDGLTDVLRQYKDVRDRLEALSRDAKVLEDEKLRLQEKISDAFQTDGLKTVNLEGLGKFTVYTTSFPRVQDTEQFEDWRKSQGIPFDVFYSVNAGKLRGYCNEQSEQGGPYPIGIEEYEDARLRWTKPS